MTYIPTKAETELLIFIKAQATESFSKNFITSQLSQNQEATKKALEGCIAKGFITEKEGQITITDLGKKQI